MTKDLAKQTIHKALKGCGAVTVLDPTSLEG